MPRTADIQIGSFDTAAFSGAGSNYLIETDTGVLYCVRIDSELDVCFSKSSDGGITWSLITTVFAGSATQLAVWYDKWSNLAGGLIHCAYTESVTDDVLYRTINTASADALSTQTSIFAGASTAANGHLSITRALGGNVYCKFIIDNGTEGGFSRLLNADVPNGAWAARTIDEAVAGSDHMILVPGFAADNQDIMGIFWDASANEVSRKIHDDSANTWAETSIATSMVELLASTAFSNFGAAVDLTNSRILLVAWSGTDLANSDLRCWTITESAITEVTNVVLDSTDDQGLAGISLDTVTGNWYAYYAGASAGGETWATSLNLYYKVSTDAGTTWGAENKLTNLTYSLAGMFVCPRVSKFRGALIGATDGSPNTLRYTAPLVQPNATHQVLGG